MTPRPAMTSRRAAPRTRPLRAAAAVLAVLALAACSTASAAEQDILAGATSTTTTSGATPSASSSATCADPTASYTPLASVPAATKLPSGSYEAEIRARGRLVVGVSADTMLFGYRDPLDGTMQGFDIDIARAVAEAVLGDPDKIEYRVISAAQRITLLQTPVEDGGVDLVVRTMTVTCDRWQQVAFSAVYYLAHQKILVAADSDATDFDDLAGQRVCAPAASTSLALLADHPDVEAVSASTHTDCLALFQEGGVDAITGDDAVLAGFAAQDPYVKVVGAALTDEPYGVAMPDDHPEFVRFVNAVLERYRSSGDWQASYDRWLKDALGTGSAPTPVYGRTS